MAEAATLAHVARPLALSAALDPNAYDIAFACDPRCRWLLRDFPGRHFPLWSQDSEHFLSALSRGKPLYDDATLHRYVCDDLDLLDGFSPHAVVGDFRLSLSVSARLRRVPYLSLANCYWSPYWRPKRYPVPSLRFLTTTLPLPIADAMFQLGRPLAFALHCGPLNRIRRKHGLVSLGRDLRRIYTDADHVLYADIAELFPTATLPTHHHFIGPLPWSPPVPHPDWWDKLPSGRPIVYLTLGSSGQGELLPIILKSLSALNITVIAATAGGKLPDAIPSNAYVAPFVSGEDAAHRAQLVVCNGGSPTSQQALAAGVPVIGIASNLDQFLNMGAVSDAGAGESMRADRFSPLKLERLVAKILQGTEYAAAARRIAAVMARYNSENSFVRIIRDVVQS